MVGLIAFGVLIMKISAVLGMSSAMITGVRAFNTYDGKGKKKGGGKGDSDSLDYLREKTRFRD
jgi:hypothetical protein